MSRVGTGPKPGRANFTTIQRETDLLSLLRSLGGVAEVNIDLMKTFNDRQAVAPRELFSSHGSMDRRTLDNAVAGLQRRNEVRTITVIVPDHLGHQIRRQLVLLNDLALNDPTFIAFLKNMQSQAQVLARSGKPFHGRRKVEGGTTAPKGNVAFPRRRFLDLDAQVVDEEAMKDALSNEWRVMAQTQGFQHGMAARARTLHLQLMAMFDSPERSRYSTICSQDTTEPRIMTSAIFYHDLPIGVIPKIVPSTAEDDDWAAFAATPQNLDMPIHAAPVNVRSFLRLGSNQPRNAIFKILCTLVDLKLLTPLERCDEETEHYYTAPDGLVSYLRPVPVSTFVSLFRLSDTAPLYRCRDAGKLVQIPLLRVFEIGSEAAARAFWQDLERTSLAGRTEEVPSQELDCVGRFFSGNSALFVQLQNPTKWVSHNKLFNTQKICILRLLQKEKNVRAVLDDEARLQHIAATVRSEADIVKTFLEQQAAMQDERRSRQAASQRRFRDKNRSESLEVGPTPAQMSQMLAQKARDAVGQRVQDWQGLITRFKSTYDVDEIDPAFLDNLHAQFFAKRTPITAVVAEKKLESWLRSRGEDLSVARGPARNQMTLGALERKAAAIKRQDKEARRQKRGELVSNAIRAQPQIEPGARPIKHRAFGVLQKLLRERLTILGPSVEKSSERRVAEGRLTRQRWDAGQDDFLRDLVAIMRARVIAVGGKVASWSIPIQLFGPIGNLLRVRLIKLEKDPKEKRYLELLTEAWLQVYKQKRGTAELPESPKAKQNEMDAGAALDLLRANIDKAFLWFEAAAPAPSGPSHLPASLDDLRVQYSVRRSKAVEPVERGTKRYAFMYSPDNKTGAERLRAMNSQALSEACEEPARPPASENDEASRGIEAVKVSAMVCAAITDDC